MRNEFIKFTIAFFILIINTCECRNKLSIFGGQETDITNFPYQCAYQSYGRLVCGCSIISNRCILTAAHCPYYYGKSLSIRVGSSNKTSGGTVYPIAAVKSHKLFTTATFDYDFAVLITTRNITFDGKRVKTLNLAAQNQVVPENTQCTVSGWGRINDGSLPSILRFVDVNIMNKALCRKSYNSLTPKFNVTDQMLCAGYSEGGKDSCAGDSGGPLVCVINNKQIQVGVVSYGYGCAVKNFPGIYSDVTKVQNWIEESCRV